MSRSKGRSGRWEEEGGGPTPQTPSAVGPSITPDWSLTQAVLKKMRLVNYLPVLLSWEKWGLMTWNQLESKNSWMLGPGCLGAPGRSWCRVWELAGLDRWLRFWCGCHLREDAGLAPPALSVVNFPALYKTLVSSFLGRYCQNHKNCLAEKVIWNIRPFTFLLFWNCLRKKIPLTFVKTRIIIFWSECSVWLFFIQVNDISILLGLKQRSESWYIFPSLV